MKRVFRILPVLFVAIAIVYGGSGINIYSYCCDDCRAEGISAIVEHKCCEIHEHKHEDDRHPHQPADHLCTQDTHFPSEDFHACSIERVEPDWSNYTSQKMAVQPVFTYIDNFVFVPDGEAPELLLQQLRYTDTQKPPDLSKDIYLDLLTTLII